MLLAAAPVWVGLAGLAGLTGCGDFWQAPSSDSAAFTLTNSGNTTVSASSTVSPTITVTPTNSFTGTVSLTCSVSAPSGATDPATCSLSPTSVTISGTSAETSTMTVASGTSLGAYEITVTGVSGSVAETTTVCVEVGSGSCTSAATTSGVFYVLNQNTSQIVAMSIVSGSLNTIGAYTLPTVHPLATAVAPNGNFLYVSTLSGIYLYKINSGGSLSLQNSGARISQDQAYTMQVDSTDGWLVDAASGSVVLNAIAINSSTGDLAVSNESEQTFDLPASTPIQLVISPGDSSSCADCYVFVAMDTGGTEAIHFDPSSSNPFGAYGNPGLLGAGDNAVAVDPTNRLLYVGETASVSGTQTGGLRVFTIGSSGITELTSAGSPYATGGTGPSSILPTADGKYVYVGNQAVSGRSTDNIASFSVSTSGLTSINTATAGPTGQIGLAEDSTGSYLLAVDFSGSPDLQAYTMSSGTLTSALTGITGTDPVQAVAIAAAP